MSRPITITEELKKQMKEEFSASLDKLKMSEGKFSYSKNFKYENSKAVVLLAPEAYNKILALVSGFSDEVGWHGTVFRSGDNEYIIEDIYVYPQEVTGSTVNTDQTAYTKWLYELDDEVFSKLRMQGHSHVNMGVSPSGVDDTHRAQILEQLEEGMFYIFMVWNKRLDIHTLIYDMEKNVLYEDKDVEVRLSGGDVLDGFMSDANEKVQKVGNKKKKSETKKQGKEQVGFDADLAKYGHYPFNGFQDSYDLGGDAWRF